jgi:hypothetical protein
MKAQRDMRGIADGAVSKASDFPSSFLLFPFAFKRSSFRLSPSAFRL